MLNVDFSINPLTNRRQIAVNGAEERLSECCGSRDIPLEEWKGNCFEVLAKKYNDDVLSVSFTGMAKDFRFLSYLKNGAETEKKLQITLTEKMVYEADELYSSIREQIYRYDTSEYLSLHEKYEDVAKGIAEIIFITPVQELSTDTLLPLLFDLERYGRYSQRKITIIDPGKVDKLPDVETALYYVHLCNLDETLFKKKKQYLEKVRSLLELRRFCSFPDTFFLCEYDNQTEEYDDINYCIDIVFKHRQFPVLPFHLKTHSFAIQEITEKFFYDYLFGERLSNYLTQVKDSFFCIEEKKQRVEDLKRQLSEIKKEREILENEKLQYQKIPKILDRELFKSAFEDDLRWYYYWHGSKIISFCTVYLYGIEYPTGTELPTTLNDRVKNFLEDLKNFFSRRDYSILHEQFCTIFPSDEEEVKLFISKFFDEWEDSDKINLFAKYEGIDYSNVSENNGKDTHYISLLDDILSFLADLEEYVMAQAGIKNLSTSVECQFYAKEQELSDREIIIYNEIDNLRKKIEESDTISGLFNFFSTN